VEIRVHAGDRPSLTGAGRTVSPRVNDRRERLGHQIDSVLGFVVSGGGDARRYREVLARWPELDHATGAAEVFLADVLSQRDRSKADEEALGLLDRFLFSRIPTPKELPLMPRSRVLSVGSMGLAAWSLRERRTFDRARCDSA
jgi:hypothetical protein